MRLLLLALLPFTLFAHSLSVTASFESGELFIESFFGDGNPCSECVFSVKSGEKVLYEEKLDEEGVFEKAVDLKAPFDVHIDGGVGHWADVAIEKSEEREEISSTEGSTISNIDASQIRAIVRSELNRQNSKIESMLKQNSSNLEKMLVGLGYLLGVFGLWQLIAKKVQS